MHFNVIRTYQIFFFTIIQLTILVIFNLSYISIILYHLLCSAKPFNCILKNHTALSYLFSDQISALIDNARSSMIIENLKKSVLLLYRILILY